MRLEQGAADFPLLSGGGGEGLRVRVWACVRGRVRARV